MLWRAARTPSLSWSMATPGYEKVSLGPLQRLLPSVTVRRKKRRIGGLPGHRFHTDSGHTTPLCQPGQGAETSSFSSLALSTWQSPIVPPLTHWGAVTPSARCASDSVSCQASAAEELSILGFFLRLCVGDLGPTPARGVRGPSGVSEHIPYLGGEMRADSSQHCCATSRASVRSAVCEVAGDSLSTAEIHNTSGSANQEILQSNLEAGLLLKFISPHRFHRDALHAFPPLT